jgi:NADH-quinone oxidoreductase subunit J
VETSLVSASRIVFDLAMVMAVVFSGLMVVNRNPVKSVLALVVAFFGLAIGYVLLFSPFIAVIQVIVYAGAILVLFLFVLMLLNIGSQPQERSGHPIQTVLGGASIVVFAALLLGTLRGSGSQIPSLGAENPAALGDAGILARTIFSEYLLHFEAVSGLLLAALVGAFVLARRERRA